MPRFRFALLDDLLCRANVAGFDGFDGGGNLGFWDVPNRPDYHLWSF